MLMLLKKPTRDERVAAVGMLLLWATMSYISLMAGMAIAGYSPKPKTTASEYTIAKQVTVIIEFDGSEVPLILTPGAVITVTIPAARDDGKKDDRPIT